jgi:hypothetical protein
VKKSRFSVLSVCSVVKEQFSALSATSAVRKPIRDAETEDTEPLARLTQSFSNAARSRIHAATARWVWRR